MATYVLKHCVRECLADNQTNSLRLKEAAGTLLWLLELEPMLENIGKTQLYVDLRWGVSKNLLYRKKQYPMRKLACNCENVAGDGG